MLVLDTLYLFCVIRTNYLWEIEMMFNLESYAKGQCYKIISMHTCTNKLYEKQYLSMHF